MEAQICHNMTFTCWRAKKIGGIIQSEVKPGEPGTLMFEGRITSDSPA